MHPVRETLRKLRAGWSQRGIRVDDWRQFADDFGDREVSVAVVGNAGYLTRLRCREQIDKCDLVIRMNSFRTRGFEDHVGERTDVCMTCFSPHTIDYRSMEGRSAPYLMSSRPNKFGLAAIAGLEHRLGEHITAGMRSLGRKHVYAPPLDYFSMWTRCLGRYPTTGMMAILFALDFTRLNVRRAFLTGFSFFEGKSHYFSDRAVDAAVNHNLAMEKKLLRPWLEEGRVEMDPIMARSVMTGGDGAENVMAETAVAQNVTIENVIAKNSETT